MLSYTHYAILLTRSRAEFIETTFDNGGQYNGVTNRTLIDIHVEPRRLHGNNNNLFADNVGGVHVLDNRVLGPFQLRNDETYRLLLHDSVSQKRLCGVNAHGRIQNERIRTVYGRRRNRIFRHSIRVLLSKTIGSFNEK